LPQHRIVGDKGKYVRDWNAARPSRRKPLEVSWHPHRPFRRARHQHGPDAGHESRCGFTHATAGAEKLWAGTVHIHPDAKTGAHHHGELESVIYVVKGRARMRWGDNLEFVAEAGPGDFIFVPPFVPHQEINASADETLECVLVRSGQEPVVVNLDIQPAESPGEVRWIDNIHRK